MASVDNVSKHYGSVQALAPTTLDFPKGRTTALIGPSGCGKSTMLRILVRLVVPDTGSVTIDGTTVDADNIEAVRRKIGYVIQDGGLFPHLTAYHNVALLARFLKMDEQNVQSRVDELAELVQLKRELLQRYPPALSGGQRQRVGLMRALMLDPALLLLDEPLGALDPITRYELQEQLKEIFTRLEKTVVLVTHDMGEAAYFADQIVLMRDGRVVQRGAYADLAHRPADEYVTNFIRAQRSPLPTLTEVA